MKLLKSTLLSRHSKVKLYKTLIDLLWPMERKRGPCQQLMRMPSMSFCGRLQGGFMALWEKENDGE
jgi:hypothetical protein